MRIYLENIRVNTIKDRGHSKPSLFTNRYVICG